MSMLEDDEPKKQEVRTLEERVAELESLLAHNRLTLKNGKNKVTIGAYAGGTGIWLENGKEGMVSIYNNDHEGPVVGIYSDKARKAVNLCFCKNGIQVYDNKTEKVAHISFEDLFNLVKKDEK